LKVTVTVVFPVMVKVQVVAVLVHPLKPATVDPALAPAVKVTDVPEIKEAEQVVAQLLIPVGAEETVPAPVPDTFTVRTGLAAVVALAVLE